MAQKWDFFAVLSITSLKEQFSFDSIQLKQRSQLHFKKFDQADLKLNLAFVINLPFCLKACLELETIASLKIDKSSQIYFLTQVFWVA